MRRPHFIAAQARHARGLLGRVIAWIMAHETRRDNQRAVGALELRPTDNVLDIGTGHGRALAEIAARTPRGLVTGVDPSELMVQIARSRNARLIRSGRVRVEQGEVARLSFPEATFDKVMSVHVLYFWPDLGGSLKEIMRVLKPGGELALVFRSAESTRAAASFPPEIYHFPSQAEVMTSLDAAGFNAIEIGANGVAAGSEPILVLANKR
jgi:SAM-dependent methyltransferase